METRWETGTGREQGIDDGVSCLFVSHGWFPVRVSAEETDVPYIWTHKEWRFRVSLPQYLCLCYTRDVTTFLGTFSYLPFEV